jgi:uncharacterized membrane protein (DUF373 family)
MESESAENGEQRNIPTYPQIEHVALVCVMVLVGMVTAYALVLSAIKLATDFLLGAAFLEKAALQDTFGLILTVIILLEFNHSIFVALKERMGAIQARTIVLIAVLVVTRKLMLQEFTTLDLQSLLGFGGLLMALGGLYWLISDGDRRRLSAATLQKPSSP